MKLANQIIRAIEWLLKISAIVGFLYLCFLVYDHYSYQGSSGFDLGDWFGVGLWVLIVLVTYSLAGFLSKAIRTKLKTNAKLANASYLQAFNEVENNDIQSQELWAKAFAKSEGNTEKQKSIYVELRTKQIAKD
jgi:hypothetical protein